MDPWFTNDERAALMENSRRSLAGDDLDPVPPALIYQPDGRGRWLITELAEDDDTAWGLCDAGIACRRRERSAWPNSPRAANRLA